MQVTSLFHNEGSIIIAICREFNIYGYGHDKKEAKSNLIESIRLYIQSTSRDEIHKKFPDLDIDFNENMIVEKEVFCH